MCIFGSRKQVNEYFVLVQIDTKWIQQGLFKGSQVALYAFSLASLLFVLANLSYILLDRVD